MNQSVFLISPKRKLKIYINSWINGVVVVTRVRATIRYPARVMLVVAMNPCPCGYYGDRGKECVCTPHQIRRYRARLSGPLMDRLDLHLEVPPVPIRELGEGGGQEPSQDIRGRVLAARGRQATRLDGEGVFCNAQLKPRLVKKYCTLRASGRDLLEQAMEQLGLSARA